ncbi:MAG: pyridoxal phosphate-dependent decarboxylase family protein [Planctomycetota bacterium]|jgi:glutamate/tyrosine decarboxylase-like PLP-dependent enzyme
MDDAYAWLRRELERFPAEVADLAVAPQVEPEEIRGHLSERFDLDHGGPLPEALDDLGGMMRRWLTHVTHPRYFGNFNPSVTPAGVLGEALAALYNPQLAVWSHAPAAVEIERYVLEFMMRRIGLDPESSAAHFTSGGAEANHTAVIAALTQCFPDYGDHGLAAIERAPRLYVSAGAHDSFYKIAHATGLGRDAVRTVPTDEYLQMDVNALRRMLREDREAGHLTFMVVATAGTTSAGVIDRLKPIVAIGRAQGLWVHTDAAWGGAVLLSDRLRTLLDGIQHSDSVTFDAHKYLSVPMGAGMFFCRHPEPLTRAFQISTAYMPGPTGGREDPYATSLQWSRRAIGLKVFLSLAHHGREGHARMIEHQAALGESLRERLRDRGYLIENQTPLPLVCFSHPRWEGLHARMTAATTRLRQAGFWLSCIFLSNGRPVLRACITSYRTEEADLEALVEALGAGEDGPEAS